MPRPSTMNRLGAAVLAAALTAVPTTAGAASTPDAADVGDRALAGSISDVEGRILDLASTVVDIGGGTRETTSEEQVTVTLDASVFFDTDKHQLKPAARRTLDRVAEEIEAAGAARVDIGGHTDHRGDGAYNQALSERRAASVRAFLAQRLPEVQLTAKGYGESEPVAPNTTEDGEDYPEGMALNRRVEITYDVGGD